MTQSYEAIGFSIPNRTSSEHLKQHDLHLFIWVLLGPHLFNLIQSNLVTGGYDNMLFIYSFLLSIAL